MPKGAPFINANSRTPHQHQSAQSGASSCGRAFSSASQARPLRLDCLWTAASWDWPVARGEQGSSTAPSPNPRTCVMRAWEQAWEWERLENREHERCKEDDAVGWSSS